MKPLIRLLALASVVFAGGAAAEPVFPGASRLGIVPPPGMTVSRSFPGFEDPERGAALSLVELPPVAYDDLAKGFSPEALKGQGVTLEVREDVQLTHGPGLVIQAKLRAGDTTIRRWALITRSDKATGVVTFQFPESADAVYSEQAVRTVLMSTVIRADVPDAERLGALPFRLTRLGGFRVARVAPAGVAMLTDGPKDEIELAEQSLFLVALGAGSPPAGEREKFARNVLASTPGVKEIRVQRSEPLRLLQGQGHEIVADAKDGKTGTTLTLVQWIRFGPGGNVRMLGVSRKESWAQIFPRLREVRDGLELN